MAIRNHPLAAHPRLQPLAQRLDGHPSLTEQEASAMLEAAAADLGIGQLDAEYSQPANTTFVPFAPDTHGSGDSYRDMVTAHLKRLEAGPSPNPSTVNRGSRQ